MGSWSPAGSIRGPEGPPGTSGPPGPPGPAAGSLAELDDAEIGAAVDQSLLYFDAATARFRADPAITAASLTTQSITDGGNF